MRISATVGSRGNAPVVGIRTVQNGTVPLVQYVNIVVDSYRTVLTLLMSTFATPPRGKAHGRELRNVFGDF